MSDHLADRHFDRISSLVEQHTGIKLPPSKRLMVEGRLLRRVRALGLDGLAQYGEAMFNKGLLESEFQNLVDSVTTNKTDFFREPQQFDLLEESLIDELRHLPERHGKPLKFWSAAASIGAEAYTLAMVLADALGTRGFEVLGTDISEAVLEFARKAVYPTSMIDPIPEAFRQTYLLLPRDPQRQEFRMVPELRKLVRFESQNLMNETYARPRDFDVIFCRNVLIYFEKAVQEQVIARLTRHLRRDGYLMLGHSESLHHAEPLGLKPVAPSVFRKVG
jgi:chemotaxis protein methyltransferase CheR/two-component system chemotaxis response regulator CheB